MNPSNQISAQRQPDVASRMNELRDAVTKLRDTSANVSERCGPVLSQQVPSGEPGKSLRSSTTVPIAMSIDEIISIVGEAQETLVSVLNRLEI
jgi:hypothetical protein